MTLARSAIWLPLTLAMLALNLLQGCVETDEARRHASAAAEIADHGGPLEQQILHMDRAIELAPERAYYWESRAGMYMSLCDNTRALEDIDQAVELADRPFLRFRRGVVLARSEQFAEAVREFNLAIAQQPDNSQFYRARALALLALGQVEAARRDTQTLFSLDPVRIYDYYVRGLVLKELGFCGQAISDLDRAVQEQSDAFFVFRARAQCQEKLGNSVLAAADVKRADRLERENGPRSGCNPRTTPFH